MWEMVDISVLMNILKIKGFRLEYVGPALHQHWANVSCYLVPG